MQPTNDAELQSLWAYLFLSRWHALGLKQVFISPGSRSTPLIQAAEAIRGLQKFVILDERSAAFTALGASKATDVPTALICTSGTAVANYFPAIIEARQSGTPLLILTADRPHKERGTGSNQTINQTEIYGNYPVFFEDAGEAEFSDEAFRRIADLAEESWNRATQHYGPAHINFPFRKPLESPRKWLEMLSDIAISSHAFQPAIKRQELPAHVNELILQSKRIVAIAGPMRFDNQTETIRARVSAWTFPVVAEAGSQLTHLPNSITGADAFLRDSEKEATFSPDLIIRIGRQPVSKGINRYLERHRDIPHLVIPHKGYTDNAHFASVTRLPEDSFEYISDQLGPRNEHWFYLWHNASENVAHRAQDYSGKALTDWHAYQEIIPEIPEDWFIMASNSFPARDLDLAGAHLLKQQPIFLNRGASGIDGITSTAIGLSLSSQKNGVLFTGDLAFLHDSTALLQARTLHKHLTLAVINNGGGQIFRMLPFPEKDDVFTTYFETPQHAHISHFAKAFSIPYRQARQPGDIAHHFKSGMDKPGLHILEILTDPEMSMKRRKNLWEQKF